MPLTGRGASSVFQVFVLMVVAACVSGCGPDAAVKSTDIRRYVVPKEKTLSADDIAQANRQSTGLNQSRQINYTLPEGWAEVSGPSGMRLATLAIGDGKDGQEISIIPASGTNRSNVERWQKQLDKDASTEEIVNTVKRTGATIKGPIPLPTRIERYTVLRSPHIDKKSREQFESRTHKRLIDIIEPTPQTVEALMKLDLASGVDVEIKI